MSVEGWRWFMIVMTIVDDVNNDVMVTIFQMYGTGKLPAT